MLVPRDSDPIPEAKGFRSNVWYILLEWVWVRVERVEFEGAVNGFGTGKRAVLFGRLLCAQITIIYDMIGMRRDIHCMQHVLQFSPLIYRRRDEMKGRCRSTRATGSRHLPTL